VAVRSNGIVHADQSVCRRFAAQPSRPAGRPLTGTDHRTGQPGL